MNSSSTVNNSLVDLLNMLQRNSANAGIPLANNFLQLNANSTANSPLDLSTRPFPSVPVNYPTIPVPTVPPPVHSASTAWQNHFCGRPLAQTVPCATSLETSNSSPPNSLHDNLLGSKRDKMNPTLQSTVTASYLPMNSVSSGLLQPINTLPQVNFLEIHTQLSPQHLPYSLENSATTLNPAGLEHVGLCMRSGSSHPPTLQKSTRDSPPAPSLTPKPFTTDQEMKKILDAPFSSDCSPQEFARQCYETLAYGLPDEGKKKTLEVLEHVINSPIYENWVNVHTLSIYDPSDVEAIWEPQVVRKPTEAKYMFYRWFIKTGRGNTEAAHKAWLRMPPKSKPEGTERRKWYQRSKEVKAEHQLQLSKGYIVAKQETRRQKPRPY